MISWRKAKEKERQPAILTQNSLGRWNIVISILKLVAMRLREKEDLPFVVFSKDFPKGHQTSHARILGALLAGDLILFVGAVFLLVILVGLRAIAKKLTSWQRLEEMRGIKRKTLHELLRGGLPTLLIIVSTLVVGASLGEYFLSYTESITSSLGQELLKDILTTDGILIGLCGVVLAQFLWAIHSKGNMLYEQMILNRKDSTIIAELSGELLGLNRTRLRAVFSVFCSMIFFLVSFMICLHNFPMTEENTPIASQALLFGPIFTLVIGSMLLIMATLQINLLPRKPTLLRGK